MFPKSLQERRRRSFAGVTYGFGNGFYKLRPFVFDWD
jgi:hypothetical protein